MSKINVEKIVYGFVIVAILFYAVAELIPTMNTAGDSINATGVPLGSLFASGGLIFLIIMAGILILVMKNFLSRTKK